MFLFLWISLCKNGMNPVLQNLPQNHKEILKYSNTSQIRTCNSFNIYKTPFIENEMQDFCRYQESDYFMNTNYKLAEEKLKYGSDLMFKGYIKGNVFNYKNSDFFDKGYAQNTAKQNKKSKITPNTDKNKKRKIKNFHNSNERKIITSKKSNKKSEKNPKLISLSLNMEFEKISSTEEESQFFHGNYESLYDVIGKFKCFEDSTGFAVMMERSSKEKSIPELFTYYLKIEKHPIYDGRIFQLHGAIIDDNHYYKRNVHFIGEIRNYEDEKIRIYSSFFSSVFSTKYYIKNHKNQEDFVFNIDNNLKKMFTSKKKFKILNFIGKVIKLSTISKSSNPDIKILSKDEVNFFPFILESLDNDYSKICNKEEISYFDNVKDLITYPIIDIFSEFIDDKLFNSPNNNPLYLQKNIFRKYIAYVPHPSKDAYDNFDEFSELIEDLKIEIRNFLDEKIKEEEGKNMNYFYVFLFFATTIIILFQLLF